MPARIVFLERHLEELRKLLFDRPDVEGAAFVLCGQTRGPGFTKLLSHAVIPIDDGEYEARDAFHLSIGSRTLVRITKLARHERLSVIFAHSHPKGIPSFSEQDDQEEGKLLPFLQARIPDRCHGTVVLTEHSIAGRVFTPAREDVDAVLCVGSRFQLWNLACQEEEYPLYDRQIRAFGADVQRTLRGLRIGIVGLGGTGSPLAEQLYRLGVGELLLFDGDDLDPSNVNRVYGSSLRDSGKRKTAIAKDSLDRIGLNTPVHAIPDFITFEDAARSLRQCDIVFGCTDKQIPRAILTQLSLSYLIPVFDLGVLIDSQNGTIRGVHGRVTTLLPGEACLFCRGRISPEVMRIEALSDQDRRNQIDEGYAPELDEPAPAVISFTTAIASAGVTELLHRLTGFMGAHRQSSEVLYSFDESRIRTNRLSAREDCGCSDAGKWGRGDEATFLGLMWPTRTK